MKKLQIRTLMHLKMPLKLTKTCTHWHPYDKEDDKEEENDCEEEENDNEEDDITCNDERTTTKRVMLSSDKPPKDHLKFIVFEESIANIFRVCFRRNACCNVSLEHQIRTYCKIGWRVLLRNSQP